MALYPKLSTADVIVDDYQIEACLAVADYLAEVQEQPELEVVDEVERVLAARVTPVPTVASHGGPCA